MRPPGALCPANKYYMPPPSPRLAVLAAAAAVAALAAVVAYRRRRAGRRRAQAKEHLRFGNALARGGKPELALKHYRLAAELNPESANAHHNAASICQRLHRFDDAVRHYERALQIKPAHLEAASNLAVALLNNKQPKEAAGACRRALEIEASRGGFNSEAFHHLNVALRLCGERAAAVEETWRQLALLDPGFRRPPPVPAHVDGPAGAASSTPLTVVCVKWGELYGAEYVNKLARGVRPWDEWALQQPLSADRAPSASLDHAEARAAPTHPRAPPAPPPWTQRRAEAPV
jgi:tetratricopeptide (TPR) repeat protein